MKIDEPRICLTDNGQDVKPCAKELAGGSRGFYDPNGEGDKLREYEASCRDQEVRGRV